MYICKPVNKQKQIEKGEIQNPSSIQKQVVDINKLNIRAYVILSP